MDLETFKKSHYFECGDGWLPLIYEAYQIVARYNGINRNNEYGPLEFTQIKEKFGYLNLYLNYYPEEIELQLLELENKSRTICERCGKPGFIRLIRSWRYCLCDECAIKEENRLKKYGQESN